MSVTSTEVIVALVVFWTTRGREIGGDQQLVCLSPTVLLLCHNPGCPGSPTVQPEGGITTGCYKTLMMSLELSQQEFKA